MLTLEKVRLGYDRTTVVHDVTIEVPDRGIVAVLGHNGAGKTTLLRGAVGLLRPMAGQILLDGENVSSLRPSARIARGLAYVPQGQQSFGDLSTRENLRLVAEQHRAPASRMSEVLDLFPALADLMERRAGLLSGGQRQQLAIARALLTGPRLLMLDEPTEGIQPNVVQLIERTIVELVWQCSWWSSTSASPSRRPARMPCSPAAASPTVARAVPRRRTPCVRPCGSEVTACI